jgi:hypothetical protein
MLLGRNLTTTSRQLLILSQDPSWLRRCLSLWSSCTLPTCLKGPC